MKMANCFRQIELLRFTREVGNRQVLRRASFNRLNLLMCRMHFQHGFNLPRTGCCSNNILNGHSDAAALPIKSLITTDSRKTSEIMKIPKHRRQMLDSSNTLMQKATDANINDFFASRNLTLTKWKECSDDIIIRDKVFSDISSSSYSTVYTQKKILSHEEMSSSLFLNNFVVSSFDNNLLDNDTYKFSNSKSNCNKNDMDKESLKPSKEQLLYIQDNLTTYLPKLFTATQDFRIYHKNIVFHNNIKGMTLNGITQYISYLSKIRIIGHLMYAFINMELLKITIHPEDGTVRLRWRIYMISGLKVLLKFWKFRFWKVKKLAEEEGELIDGFSIFYVGNDGLVFKHICDKMMPDENPEVLKPNKLGIKLALLFGGLIPQSTIGIGSILNCCKPYED